MSKRSFPALSIVYNVFAIPYNFLIGFIVGLAAPVAAIAAMVAGVRLVTGRIPFLSQSQGEEEARRLSIELVSADEATGLYEAEIDKVKEDLGSLQAEIKAILQEARGEAPQPTESGSEEL